MSAHAAPTLVLSRCASFPRRPRLMGHGDACAVHNAWMNGIMPHRGGGTTTTLSRCGCWLLIALLGRVHFDPILPFDYLDEHTGNTDMRHPDLLADFLETYLVNQTMGLLDGGRNVPRIGKEQPWFIHLSFVSPHPPSNVPLEWQGTFANVSLPRVVYGGPEEVADFPSQLKAFQADGSERAFPGGVANHTYIREERQKYYELASYVDAQIGRLMAFLDARGLSRDTLVIFTSDHGTNLYDHGLAQVQLPIRPGACPSSCAALGSLALARRPSPRGLTSRRSPAQRGQRAQLAWVGTTCTAALALECRRAPAAWRRRCCRGSPSSPPRGNWSSTSMARAALHAQRTHELTNPFDEPSRASVRAKLMVALFGGAPASRIGWLQQHVDPSHRRLAGCVQVR